MRFWENKRGKKKKSVWKETPCLTVRRKEFDFIVFQPHDFWSLFLIFLSTFFFSSSLPSLPFFSFIFSLLFPHLFSSLSLSPSLPPSFSHQICLQRFFYPSKSDLGNIKELYTCLIIRIEKCIKIKKWEEERRGWMTKRDTKQERKNPKGSRMNQGNESCRIFDSRVEIFKLKARRIKSQETLEFTHSDSLTIPSLLFQLHSLGWFIVIMKLMHS